MTHPYEPTAPSPQQVDEIVNAMLDAAEDVLGDTDDPIQETINSNTLISAVFTLCAVVLEGALACGADPDAIREAVSQLYDRLPHDTRKMN